MPDALFDAMDSIKLSLLLAFSCPRLLDDFLLSLPTHVIWNKQYNTTQRNATQRDCNQPIHICERGLLLINCV
ncbi:hypothetical protein I7I50_09563 [Histoplasma capsulatum G186AR]|uniref:Uncharacterized protein n=1 Tax=Ajellomyces capsulatus TaxID=5037 RepID=A0A8H7YSF6_AJECA|nr:hypothetical protein I7I52_07084 [Histoplasma capsulatum]QSS74419.1 hypothetical protein I7I50_09563 [Histoplasma capsulatum G186AR]